MENARKAHFTRLSFEASKEVPAANVDLKPPPGSYTGHTDISHDESLHNMLSDRRYTMKGDD